MIDLDPTRCLSAWPGDDGVLISRREIRDWLARVEAGSDRLRVWTLGTSTEGRPIDAVVVAENIAGDRLDALLDRRRATVDRLLRGAASTDHGPPIVLITSGIHATEVGGPQSIPELIHWLVFDESPQVRRIRERVLTIVVPTLNPDGMDLVQRWHEVTAGTLGAGTMPPLLYHRHAGHDNNRDWIFRNLRETQVALDGLHRPLLPHVTLDQHQMNPQGPRFVLPPYADPWEPHIHPAVAAAANGLGHAIATDLTLSGLAGVTTGRYFDAWEPSRAIQHYRGGVRILAEAASARLAQPIEVSREQLAAPPLPQDAVPSSSTPRPWPGGTWRLRDIVDYHLAAATSLLGHVAADPDRWLRVQRESLETSRSPGVTFHVPLGRPSIDLGANQRLAEILDAAGLTDVDSGAAERSVSAGGPLGRLAAALLLPKPFTAPHGGASYDVTTHHLPLMAGAVVTTGDDPADPRGPAGPGRWLVVDARAHRAPELAELARHHGEGSALRATVRQMVGTTVIEPGSWLIDRAAVPRELHCLAHAAIDEAPRQAGPVRRRDVALLAVGDQPTADHGWTRWWLEARRVPYLEADPSLLDDLRTVAASTLLLVADTPVASIAPGLLARVSAFVDAGGHVIAFGQAGRSFAEPFPGVASTSFPAGGPVHAPGALLRLLPARGHPISLGLDRMVPAMLQRDGVFEVSDGATDVDVLGRFAGRDTVLSGWMSHLDAVRNAPAIVEVRRGRGRLHAFAFRPLFRGQMLVSAPLVHNLIYSMERTPCPPLDPGKTSAGPTSDPTS